MYMQSTSKIRRKFYKNLQFDSRIVAKSNQGIKTNTFINIVSCTQQKRITRNQIKSKPRPKHTTEIAVVWTVSLCPRNVWINTGLLSVGFTGRQGVFAPLAGWFSGLRCGGGANRNHVGAVQFLATVTRNSVQSTERWQFGVDWTSVNPKNTQNCWRRNQA